MDSNRESTRRRLERLGWFLDSAIPIPGLNYRIGIDPLIGLLPWFGDAVGALLSSYIISEAARLGAPKSVLMKMTFNVALDAIAGALPFAGDIFDFAWKANQRNLRLLEHYMERPRETVITSRLFVLGLILFLVLFIGFIAFLGYALMRMIWMAVTGG